MKEIWKKFKAFEVSNLGRVRGPKGIIGYLRYPGDRKCVTERRINGKQYPILISRLVAMAFIPNPKKLKYVDHIDRNKLNDKANNLRWVSSSINNMNVAKKVKKGNLSTFKGVTKRWRKKPWQAYLRLKNGKDFYIGSFATEKEAAIAYNRAVKKEYNNFAYQNIIE